MKQDVKQPVKNKDIFNLLIAVTAALCIGGYLIITTTFIAKDGTNFINYAKELKINPVKTMTKNDQHPGYPLLILSCYKIKSLFCENQSITDWIVCAQSVTLIFRLLALIVLYYIGKLLFGANLSFWGILILICLPNPAKVGSDALSDWTYLFFFVMGLFLLFKAAESKRWQLFGFVGFIAGIGYLVRPECIQLIIYGFLWLGTELFYFKRSMSKQKILYALLFLFISFFIIAGPYMTLKGKVFPKKEIYPSQIVSNTCYFAEIIPSNIVSALEKLVQNICETLLYVFVPVMLTGMYKWMKTKKWYEPQYFFLIAVLTLNVLLMIWLYCNHGYMSYRHTLSLLIIPILYIPYGLQELVNFRFFNKKKITPENHDKRFWFLFLSLTGILMCMPKLLRPIRIEKQSYRVAAEWLKNNTNTKDTVAVPDARINFYAERLGHVYESEDSLNGLVNCAYTVKIVKILEENEGIPGNIQYECVYKVKKHARLIILKN